MLRKCQRKWIQERIAVCETDGQRLFSQVEIMVTSAFDQQGYAEVDEKRQGAEHW